MLNTFSASQRGPAFLFDATKQLSLKQFWPKPDALRIKLSRGGRGVVIIYLFCWGEWRFVTREPSLQIVTRSGTPSGSFLSLGWLSSVSRRKSESQSKPG